MNDWAYEDVIIFLLLLEKSERNGSSSSSIDLRNRHHRDHERSCWSCVFLVLARPLADSAELIRCTILFLVEFEIFRNLRASGLVI